MQVTIDSHSGFCFGVVYAIQMAEDELDNTGQLYCLGDIVHNNVEVDRLRAKGLEIIDHERLKQLKDYKVLIRAHGEPPETYKIALEKHPGNMQPKIKSLKSLIRTTVDRKLKKDLQLLLFLDYLGISLFFSPFLIYFILGIFF